MNVVMLQGPDSCGSWFGQWGWGMWWKNTRWRCQKVLLADSFCNETSIQMGASMMISDLMVSQCVGIWFDGCDGCAFRMKGFQHFSWQPKTSWRAGGWLLLGFRPWCFCKVLACEPQGGGEDLLVDSRLGLVVSMRAISWCFPPFGEPHWSGTVQKPIDCFSFWLAVLWVQQLKFLCRVGIWSHLEGRDLRLRDCSEVALNMQLVYVSLKYSWQRCANYSTNWWIMWYHWGLGETPQWIGRWTLQCPNGFRLIAENLKDLPESHDESHFEVPNLWCKY